MQKLYRKRKDMKKKKIAQLYIPIFYQKSIEDKENYVENKMTLISANKIE